jgi:hypothetical protein
VGGECDGREILALYAGCFVRKEGIKDIGAATRPQRELKMLAETVGRECLSEAERASGNLRFDSRQELTRATQVRFVRSPPQRWPVALTVNAEVELDAIVSEWSHASRH